MEHPVDVATPLAMITHSPAVCQGGVTLREYGVCVLSRCVHITLKPDANMFHEATRYMSMHRACCCMEL